MSEEPKWRQMRLRAILWIVAIQCSTGCGAVVYPLRGQCLAHLDPLHVPAHPWTPHGVHG